MTSKFILLPLDFHGRTCLFCGIKYDYLPYELEFSANKVLGTFLGVHR